jgi:hypothetical protein
MRGLLVLVTAGLLAGSIEAAQAGEWCGFREKAQSPVRCGYSSFAECKQKLGDSKDTVCIPSPSFAQRRAGHAGQSAARPQNG